jgi:hypothetical protein
MGATKKQLLVSDTPHTNVRVARFIQPDMRDQLYDSGAIADCSLFQELHAAVLTHLTPADTVVLNLALIDWFPTAFYRFLLRLNEEIVAAGARFLMCCLPPLANEAFDLMGGKITFAGQVFESEARAIFAATKPVA